VKAGQWPDCALVVSVGEHEDSGNRKRRHVVLNRSFRWGRLGQDGRGRTIFQFINDLKTLDRIRGDLIFSPDGSSGHFYSILSGDSVNVQSLVIKAFIQIISRIGATFPCDWGRNNYWWGRFSM